MSSDTGIDIVIDDSQWEETGGRGHEATRLHTSLRVNGVLVHATALQVRELKTPDYVVYFTPGGA